MDKPGLHGRAFWGHKFNLTPGETRGLTLAMLEQLEKCKSNAARRLLLFGMYRRWRRPRKTEN
jgi:hypothetical protein